ncbi:MAG: formyl transferase [Nitrospinota bacterium]|nr:formyl transferase [Nitrospinota bacterium]
MKKAILTNDGSLFGRRMLAKAAREGSPFTAIIAIRQPVGYYWRLFKGVARRLGLVDTLKLAVMDRAAGKREAAMALAADPELTRPYTELAEKVYYTDGTNSPQTEEILRELAPDILALGQCGIVRKNILAIPRLGTLNAHPGVLPWYRGMDSYKWALVNGEPEKIGVSVHWVDEKVDTGKVILVKQLLIPPGGGYNDIQGLLHDLCAGSMTETISRLEREERLPGAPQDPAEGKQYYKMPPGMEPAAMESFARLARTGKDK